MQKKLGKINNLLDYKVFFDNSRDGFLVADASSRKFIMANKAMCKMLGYTRKELENMSVKDIHPKKFLPDIFKIFEGSVQKRSSLDPFLPL